MLPPIAQIFSNTASAHNFVAAIKNTTAQQVIYLSGIVNEKGLSKHLRSRHQVEEILASGPVPLTTLRAGIIVGSGSASFEIIRDLVEKLPIMIAPRWLNTACQPIAIRNFVAHFLGEHFHGTCRDDVVGRLRAMPKCRFHTLLWLIPENPV